MQLFPFSDYWLFYAGFLGFVFIMLALDLGVFNRKAHEITFKESAIWSIVWITLSLTFNLLFYFYADWKFNTDPVYKAMPGFDHLLMAKQMSLEFLTGYIIEKSLSIDNIFVFVVVFQFFGIPLKYQHRVLYFGILGALIFRMIFIAMGSLLLQYQWVLIVFGIFLIFTGFKIIFAPEKPMDPGKNPLIKLFRKFFPVTPTIEGQKFFVRKNKMPIKKSLVITYINFAVVSNAV